jgi:HEAT repeat protein
MSTRRTKALPVLALLAALAGAGAVAQDAWVREWVALLRDRNPDLRYRAAVALGNMGAEARAAVPALLRLFQDDRSEVVREEAAAALKRIDPAAAKKAGLP